MIQILNSDSVTVSCNRLLIQQDLQHKKIIGHSVIIQDVLNYQIVLSGEISGSATALLFSIRMAGKYKVTVFPILSTPIDYHYLGYISDSMIYSELIYIADDINSSVVTTSNKGKVINY